jgi:penicillin-binding protein 2
VNKKLIIDEVLNITPSRKSVFKGLRAMHKERIPVELAVSKNFGWRLFTLFITTVTVLLIFVFRIFHLQLANSSKYQALADSNKSRNMLILAERGVIYSSDNKMLVRNKPSFAVEINTSLCADLCPKIINKVAQLILIDADAVEEAQKSGKSVFLLASNIDQEKALLLEANLFQLPGVSVIVYPVRDYINPSVYAHSLGYVGLDDSSLEPNIVGKNGVEQFYNDYLSGIPGRKITEVDSTGTKYDVVAVQDALPGRDVRVYLHDALSQKAFDLLKDKVNKKEAKAGVVVAQDPFTGGVLALVSYPSFDANKMSTGLSQSEYDQMLKEASNPFFNRAVSAVYPPGSTFKLVTASAALSQGVVTKDTTIFDPGYLSVNGFRFNNWRLDGHGEVNIVRALQVSNDTYFYTVGGGYGDIKGIGIDGLYTWARRFGVSVPSGIDIYGEEAGYMPNGKSNEWYLGNTYIASIGQGDVLATPLQMNVIASYFANGGKIIKPQIVKSIKGVKDFEPKIISQGFLSKENYDIVREGLHQAVSPGGTGYPVFDFAQKHPGIELAGKTGTSEYIDEEGKPATHAWFSVFGPYIAGDTTFSVSKYKKPIAITVFLESGGAGSDDAAPIARELLDLWFTD